MKISVNDLFEIINYAGYEALVKEEPSGSAFGEFADWIATETYLNNLVLISTVEKVVWNYKGETFDSFTLYLKFVASHEEA